VADLESLAKKLNPAVGFYDPLGLAQTGMGEAGTLASEEAVIGFLRAAEIKVALGLGPGPGLGLRGSPEPDPNPSPVSKLSPVPNPSPSPAP